MAAPIREADSEEVFGRSTRLQIVKSGEAAFFHSRESSRLNLSCRSDKSRLINRITVPMGPVNNERIGPKPLSTELEARTTYYNSNVAKIPPIILYDLKMLL